MSENEFLHETKRDGITSLQGIYENDLSWNEKNFG